MKKVLSFLLVLLLCLSLLPAPAPAADGEEAASGPAIRIVNSAAAAAAVFPGGQKSSVYFGSYKQSAKEGGGFNVDPIKWRVLENASGRLFLLADGNLDATKFDEPSDTGTWARSTVRSWLNGYGAGENLAAKDYSGDSFLGAAFTAAEAAVIGETFLPEPNPYSSEFDATDKVFLLSVEEAMTAAYGFADSADKSDTRRSRNTAYTASGGRSGEAQDYAGNYDCWWLRSKGTYTSSNVAAWVSVFGEVYPRGATAGSNYPIRPALNLELSSALLATAADGGKAGSLGELTPVEDYAGSEWKLTLLDEGRRSFGAFLAKQAGGMITIEYTYATAAGGSNEYISALIVNDLGEVTCYGRLATLTGFGGTVSVDVTGKFHEGDTLYVFQEQMNGDGKTDFASPLREIKISADIPEPVPSLQLVDRSGEAAADILAGGQESIVYFGSYKQSAKAGGGFNVDPIKWRVLENASGRLFLLADGNLDAMPFDSSGGAVRWGNATIRSWLNGYGAAENKAGKDYSGTGFLGSAFSAAEAAAIGETEITGTGASTNPKDRVFLLSEPETISEIYGFVGDSTRQSRNTAYAAAGGGSGAKTMEPAGSPDNWWLRTRGEGGYDNPAMYIDALGQRIVTGMPADINLAVRPALKLELSRVLLLSSAGGGKGGSLGTLAPVDKYSGTEWKLTLLDEGRSGFEAHLEGQAGNTVTVGYSGASAGDREYISALIVSAAGEITYYGRLAQASASGTVTADIGGKLALGDELFVFHEQVNGDGKTDLASPLRSVLRSVSGIRLADHSGETASADFLTGAQGSSVYFGAWKQQYGNIAPIKWRVLENAGGKLFLLSDALLGKKQYHEDWEDVTWDKSTIRSWLNGYGAEENDSGKDYSGDHFLIPFYPAETAAIPQTALTTGGNPDFPSTVGGGDTKDRVFYLSWEEVTEAKYGFAEANAYDYARRASDSWWLRTPGFSNSNVALVDTNGKIYPAGNMAPVTSISSRPALKMALSALLFASPAEGGKSSGDPGPDALQPVGGYGGSEWKLTLLDPARKGFQAACEGAEGTVWTVSYSGAATGDNDYISALVVNGNGEVTHYGRLVKPEAEKGSFTVDVGDKLGAEDTLYVFSEQANGDKRSDCASPLRALEVPIRPASIRILTEPKRLEYFEGEAFQPEPMEAAVTYTDGSRAKVKYDYEPAGPLTADVTAITVSYTEDGVTVKTTVDIKVWAKGERYTATWYDGDGSVLDFKTFAPGEEPPTTSLYPTLEDDDGFYYKFNYWEAKWDGGNVAYSPVFTKWSRYDRIVAEVHADGTIKFTIYVVSKRVRVFAASYDAAGRLREFVDCGYWTSGITDWSFSFESGLASGDTVKIMMVEPDTLRPLCEAWSAVCP